MEDWLLVALIAIEMAFDAIVVAYLAALKTIPRFESYLESSRAEKYYLKIANVIKMMISPEISEMECRITKDLDSRIGTIQADIKYQLQGIKIPEIPPFPQFDQEQLLADLEFSFKEIMNEQITAQLQTFKIELKAEIIDSIKKSELQAKGAAARALKGQLEGVDDMIESLGEEMQKEFLDGGTTADLIKTEILGTTLPKGYAKQHPVNDLIVKLGKMTALQMLDAGALGPIGRNTNEGINNTQGNIRTSPYQ
jgi:hypothetical protein